MFFQHINAINSRLFPFFISSNGKQRKFDHKVGSKKCFLKNLGKDNEMVVPNSSYPNPNQKL